MPNLLEERYGHGSVAMGNKFYVIGGNTHSCEVFDKVSGKFARIKQSPRPLCSRARRQLEMFRVQNVVKLDEKEDNVCIYDTVTDKWTSSYVDMFESHGRNSIIYKF